MKGFAWLVVITAASAVALGFGWGCSSSNHTSFSDDGGGGGDDAGGGGDDGGLGGDTNPQQNLSCSPDLQNVVDPNGNVVEQCPSDQGCSGGQCVPACQAAAA